MVSFLYVYGVSDPYPLKAFVGIFFVKPEVRFKIILLKYESRYIYRYQVKEKATHQWAMCQFIGFGPPSVKIQLEKD